MARFAVGVSLVLLVTSFAFAQSDPQALTYAAQAMTALTGGTAISDVTLAGSATRTAGSDVETGTATLYAKGYESRIDMSLNDGNRSEIRNSSSGPQGEWIGPDGTARGYSYFNCMTDTAWFFPALSSLASANNQNQTLSYVGQETRNGGSVQHLRSIWSGQSLSTMDIYLDAGTFLPVEVDLHSHPDNDSSTNISVQVLYSNYEVVNGADIPYHIQEILNGSVLLDLTASSAILNSGLPDSLFTLQ